jgi:hypothetical protein
MFNSTRGKDSPRDVFKARFVEEISQNRRSLKDCFSFKKDHDVVLCAVTKDGLSLQYADSEIKKWMGL